MKLRHTKEPVKRGSRSSELLFKEPSGTTLVFNPLEDLPQQEIDWIKDETEKNANTRISRTLKTSWMRWKNPEYLDWVHKKNLPRPGLLKAFTEKIHSDEEMDNFLAIQNLADVVEVYPSERKIRPELPEIKQKFVPGEEHLIGAHISTLGNFIKIWPEHREQIIRKMVGDVPAILSRIVPRIIKWPAAHFVDTAGELLVIFPQIRPEIEEAIVQRSEEIKQALQQAAQKAKNPSVRTPFDSFIAYQRILRGLTIVEAGESFIDEKGDIHLKARRSQPQRSEGLPERPYM